MKLSRQLSRHGVSIGFNSEHRHEDRHGVYVGNRTEVIFMNSNTEIFSIVLICNVLLFN